MATSGKAWRRRFTIGGSLFAAAAVGAVSGVAVGATGDDATVPPASIASSPGGQPAPVIPANYPRNAAGLTYGSLELASTPDQAPDLILVEDTAGESGYVYRTELDSATGADVANPGEAAEWQRGQDALAAQGGYTSVTVYLSDGTTAIGEFIVRPSQLGGDG